MGQLRIQRGMRRGMRVCLLVIPLFLVACGGASGAGTDPGQGCTMIGAPSGVGVDVDPGVPAEDGRVEACWDGSCQTFPLELRQSTEVDSQTCTGDDPDDSCSASSRKTGGKHGFVDIPDLPEGPVRVELTLDDDKGDRLVHQSLDTVADPVYPNGPECGSAGPQAQFVVDENGRLTSE